ncbi:PP0621 family protein [Helicobacter sp.]|uniref:PP0621 family protein n=1 Tax=Helicobacter sp. TaxID=218 RepID=UPI0025BD8E20|nr:PP0621 family protein [Helicobacter sp.]
MMKFLIILFALALLAYMIARPFIRHHSSKKDKPQDNIEEMYQCAHCGVYVSSTEAIFADGMYFCSKDCLKKGAKQ